jgi:methyl-accepting chemotaxis protein
VRFILKLAVGQQLLLQFALFAPPLAYLGYRVGIAGNDGYGLAFAVIGLVAAGLVSLLVARRAAESRDRIIAVSRRLAHGDFAAAREADNPAEAALAELGAALQARQASDEARALTSARLQASIDKLAINVMVADADGKIVYMNEAVRAMFRANAVEIRKQLPHFDADKVLGASFDTFHKTPAHQRGLVAGLRDTHTADMRLGESTLRIVATPVVGAGGARLGTVVQWLDRTVEVSVEQEVKFVVEAAGSGDLTRRLRSDGKSGLHATLTNGVNSLLETNASLVRLVKDAARAVTSGAEEISQGNQSLRQRTEQQASSLEETASSMEEMTSTVKQNADNAAQANQLAAAARLQAEKGGAVVSEAVTAMQGINSASNKIADIIGVIDELAFQTNLLALTAAVEAARAGEQGRGFAVVASEVRNLASRSAEAAKEIKGLIQDSVGRVAQGSKLVDQSGATLTEIVASVKKVTDIVSEIAAASAEQSAGIEQVNKAVTSMDEVTQQNAALVEEAAAAAESLLDQSRQLDEMMAKYRVIDEKAPAWSGEVDRRRRDAWKSTATSSAPAAAPERRSASRPWSKRATTPSKPAAAPSPVTAPKPVAAPKPAPVRASGAGDTEDWTEF